MFAALDVLFTCLKTFVSCLINRKKLAKRSWRGEFIFRLAKSFLTRSIGKDFKWIRDRQKLLTLFSPDLLKVSSEKLTIAGVNCIAMRPKNLPDPAKTIVYFHGGGYAVGSADGYQLMAAKIALMNKANVVVVDYRLVPEFTLPAAQDDCYAVTQALLTKPPKQKLILMGDSAGGALCLATLKRLKTASNADLDLLSRITACVLISPWLTPLSYENLSLENEATDMLDRHITQYWVDTFYQTEVQKEFLDFSDISSLGIPKDQWPKLYIQVAGAEVFLKQVLTLSEQLEALDIKHDIDNFADQFHVFQTFSPLVPEAKDALKGVAAFLRSA